MKIKILIPVYNDFESVSKLLADINSTISNIDNRAYIFTRYYFHQIAPGVHVKDNDGQFVFLAKGKGGGIHYLKAFCDDIVKRNGIELGGTLVFFGIGCINAIDPYTFQNDIGLDFNGS